MQLSKLLLKKNFQKQTLSRVILNQNRLFSSKIYANAQEVLYISIF